MDKFQPAFSKDQIKTLCLKWEAIRRNQEYWDDYNKHLELEIKMTESLIENMKNKMKPKTAISKFKYGVKPISEICSKWGLAMMIDPKISYYKKLFPTSGKSGNYMPNKKLENQVYLLFDNYSVRCQESLQDFGVFFYGNDNKPTETNESPKSFRSRQTILLYVNITKPKKEIMPKIDAIIDLYIKNRQKYGFEKRTEEKNRFRLASNDIEIFETYDFMNSKKGTCTNWTKAAKERYPNYHGDKNNLIKKVQQEYKRAHELIKGGFRNLGL